MDSKTVDDQMVLCPETSSWTGLDENTHGTDKLKRVAEGLCPRRGLNRLEEETNIIALIDFSL